MNLKGLAIIFVIGLTFLVGVLWQKANTLSNNLNLNTSPTDNRVMGDTDLIKAEPSTNPTATPTRRAVVTLMPTQKPIEQQASWTKVKSWSGKGSLNTEQFNISGSQWRVDFTLQQEEYGNLLQVYVYDSNNEFVDLPVNTMTAGNGTSYMYRKGSFYLKINGTGNWSVTVEEFI